MDAEVVTLEVEYQKSLSRAAELKVQLDRARGIGLGKVVPHSSVIEEAAHAAGMAFSRELQERHMREMAATHVGTARCPKCGERCAVDGAKRKVTGDSQSSPSFSPFASLAGIVFPFRSLRCSVGARRIEHKGSEGREG